MSDGKTHSIASIGSGIGLASTGLLAFTGLLQPDQLAIAGVSCGILGLLLTPDLDVDAKNISSYWARKFFLTDFFFNIVFESYRKGITHRNWRSHFPIISTFIRLLYLFFPPIIIIVKNQPTSRIKLLLLSLPATLFSGLLWVGTLLLLQYFPVETIIHYIIGIVYGLVVSDTIHYIFDSI